MKKTILLLLILSVTFPVISWADSKAMQSLGESSAFPIDEDQVAVRVSVRPNDLDIKGEVGKTLNQFTVVVCVPGHCEFAKPNIGLGFFETKFPVPKLEKGDSFKTIIVACSRVGCVKSARMTRVIYPQDKF